VDSLDKPDNQERYAQAFRQQPETRVTMFIDIVGSMAYKQDHPQSDWLNAYGKVFDIIEGRLLAHSGETVKFLGDGVLAVFGEDDAAKAINAAIEIQEQLNEENRAGRIKCLCSIGIATGNVVRFETTKGTTDYIGSKVDLAKRLCEAANGQAIWADDDTIANAQMGRVRSKLGDAQGWPAGDYLTERQTAVLKGFPSQVAYYEILWLGRPFGTTNATLTEATGRLARATRDVVQREAPQAQGSRPVPTRVLSGTLQWMEERSFGFIDTEDGGSYYTDSRYIVEDTQAKSGARAFFIPRPPNQEGKKPVAAAVVFKDQELIGWVARIAPTGRFCFIETFDDSQNKQDFFHFLGDSNPGGLEVDDEVRFTVLETARGLQATRVAKIQETPQAA
jgi:class 3 adenylate cyclase/cold shock CspA family protein